MNRNLLQSTNRLAESGEVSVHIAVLDDMHERAMHSYAARYVHGDVKSLNMVSRQAICNVRSRMLGLRDLQRIHRFTWFPERKDAARLECFKLFHFLVVQSEAAQVKIGSHPIRPCGLG